MASNQRKSQFYGCVPLFIFTIILNLISSLNLFAADINPSRYELYPGESFYLLAEQTFSSEEFATIRLELVGQSEINNGIDFRLYKIPRPLTFLSEQKNLHRPNVSGIYKGEGIRNALNYVWDVFYKKSRLIWQRILTYTSRKKAVESVPGLKQAPPNTYNTQFENNPQYQYIKGLELVNTFRYPALKAKPIKPGDIKLDGSSSHFLDPEGSQGNVKIPFGKLAPGLYLVEGLLGSFRAVCLLFVSDTVAVTKISSDEMAIWTVDRKKGNTVSGTEIKVTDGLGTLGNGKTNEEGIYFLRKKNLEHTYVFGEDKSGGVFVSENFYYDSQIYSKKIFIQSDRPLYRPGEEIQYNIIGRNFVGALKSLPLEKTNGTLSLLDPTGAVIWNKMITIDGDGASGSVQLPSDALSGGYEFNLKAYNIESTGYVRVANFVKPHFDLNLQLEKNDYHLSEEIKGKVILTYPNGSPVKEANCEIVVKRQLLAITEGSISESNDAQSELVTKSGKSNSKGEFTFSIEALKSASRLIIQARAVDQNSFRVSKTREMMISSDAGLINVISDQEFSKPGEKIHLKIQSFQEGNKNQDFRMVLQKKLKLKWQMVHLEDQKTQTGDLTDENLDITLEKSGHYNFHVVDEWGNILATKAHFVEGEKLISPLGTITILFDKGSYQINEIAHFIIQFPSDVEEALMTLEREKIEKWSTGKKNANWLTLDKSNAKMWKGSIKLDDYFAPNITFSVVFVKNGQYVFENKGIKVYLPQIEITHSYKDKKYLPGEVIELEIQTKFENKPIQSTLSVGVIDETIYALQPELAPTLFEFFYHTRRNQVKTSASLSFHSFDSATSAINFPASSPGEYEQRDIKVLKDRARREDKDTAYWNPKLQTDIDGKIKIAFKVPDSLTKWRITTKAVAGNWKVGQKLDYFQSSKDFYHTYSGPKNFRKGDRPEINYILFNNTGKVVDVDISLGKMTPQKIQLGLDPTYVNWKIDSLDDDQKMTSLMKVDSKAVDVLESDFQVDSIGWKSSFVLKRDEKIPQDAKNIRAYSYNDHSEKILNSLNNFWEYPYGCVEQISSKLISLSLAYVALEKNNVTVEFKNTISEQLSQVRSQLIRLASDDAEFTWWGDHTKGNLLLKTYAFFADFKTLQALNQKLPGEHWESLLNSYKDLSEATPFSINVLVLWMFREMNLPIKNLVDGLLEKMPNVLPSSDKITDKADDKADGKVDDVYGYRSLYFDREEDSYTNGISILLLNELSNKNEKFITPEILLKSKERLAKSSNILARAIVLNLKEEISKDEIDQFIENLNETSFSTFDRSLAMTIIWKKLDFSGINNSNSGPGIDWKKNKNKFGIESWTYVGKNKSNITFNEQWRMIFDSNVDQKTNLPVKIKRTFYELEKIDPPKEENANKDVDFIPLEKFAYFKIGNEVLPTDFKASEIYVDKIELTSEKNYSYSILEIPMMTGTDLETQTWALHLKDGEEEVELGLAQKSYQNNHYIFPIEMLDSVTKYYGLIRPSMQGEFVLPPVRFYRMYATRDMAFEGESKLDFKKVIVR